jgi:ATP adenylyltransferase
MKRDRDDTDFRGIAESYGMRDEGCLFCNFQTGQEREIEAENELCYAIPDGFPVTDDHTLIIPKRHISDFFELHQPEINAVHSLMDEMRRQIEKLDDSVSGFNVGINSGEDAGQTISHCHIHLIPRRKGDVENPKGGVRGVIPDKRIY